jgi:integrating conjugative element relaxase (TIGR03760 family)
MEVVLFHRPKKNASSALTKSLKDLTQMVPAASFLAENKRSVLLQKMKEYSGLEPSRYESLCLSLIDNLVNYCQNLPETTNSYYSQAGGLVDHALNRTEAALSLFQQFMLQEQPNLLSEEQKLWQYALYSTAILQGIGKLFVDYRVNLFDGNGQALKEWNPLLESLTNTGKYYAYDFQKEADVEFRRRLNLLIARTLMPVSGFNWIASNPTILAIWLALLNEDYRSAGTLGAILIRADAIAIQRYFSEFMVRNAAGKGGRYGTFSGGVPETITDKEQAIGIEFIQWLMNSLSGGLIMINKAPLLSVPGGLLMSQEMFQLFMRENPEYKNWQAVKNGFLSLGLHSCGADGSVISRFDHGHDKTMHSGIVFSEYSVAMPESVSVQLSSGKVASMSALELIHTAQENSQLNTATTQPLQHLSASGQWLHVDQGLSPVTPGARTGA